MFDEIAQRLVSISKTLDQNADAVALEVKKRLPGEFAWLQAKTPRAISTEVLAGQEPFSTIVFLTVEGGIPVFTVRAFRVSQSADQELQITVDKLRCPGNRKSMQYVAY